MDRDQAAAILGTAHDAYFEVPCEACGGRGEVEVDMGYRVGHETCPTCDGNGETKMPRPYEILKAAHKFVGTK